MAVEKDQGVDDSVRLHVGGLPRGTQPEALSTLIARVLPEGTIPTAEIMKDQSTGIERGFGYVTVPRGRGVKAGVERAISVYNGTRWRGSRIRVGVAKGDYLERLKAEWKEAEEVQASAQAVLSEMAAVAKDPAKRKSPPVLRLRRRPGERIMLVDTMPIPWTKPAHFSQPPRAKRSRNDTKEAGEEGAEEGGEGEEGEEYHRRKRGVLGCRRKVVFQGRAATCSTKAKDLWRRHLQERAAEVSAARLRAVDRLVTGEKSELESAGKESRDDRVVLGPAAEEGDDAAEYLPLDAAADLEPEEAPLPAGIEFVWHDDADDENTSTTRSPAGSLHGDGTEDVDRYDNMVDKEDDVDNDMDDGTGDMDDDDDDGEVRDGGAEVEEELEDDRDEGGAERRTAMFDAREVEPSLSTMGEGGRQMLGMSLEDIGGVGPGKTASEAISTTRERGSRNKSNHGVDMDERLAELLSDGSDDEDNGSGAVYDYELETAKKAQAARDDTSSGVLDLARETIGGMSERLQSETERSLSILAQLLGGEYTSKASRGNTTVISHDGMSSNGPTVSRTTTNRLDCSRLGGDGISGDADAASAPVGGAENAGPALARGFENADGSGTHHDTGGAREEQDGKEGLASTGDNSGGSDGKSCAEPVASIAGNDRSDGQERFVAHMPTLTDIFKVEDKQSTKKNQAEKDKDKSFRIASLFGDSCSTAPTSATGVLPDTASSAAPAASGGAFSFSFGGSTDAAVASTEESHQVEGVATDNTPGESCREGVKVGLGGRPAKDHQMDGHPSDVSAVGIRSRSTADGTVGRTAAPQESQDGESLPTVAAATSSLLWRPLAAVVTVAAGFVRTGSREEIESTWIQERRALTQDFKRKHKDAVKGRRGATWGVHGARGAGKKHGAGPGAQRNNSRSGSGRM